MNRFFKRYQKTIIWMLVVGFVASIVVAGGLRLFSSPEPGSAEETILTVDGRKISRQEYAQAYGNLIDYYRQLYAQFGLADFETLLQGSEGAFRALTYRAQAAEELVRSTLLNQAARELRVSIARAELDRAVNERLQALLAQFGLTEREFEDFLRFQGTTLDAYKRDLAAEEEARLREQRIRQLVVGPVEPTDAELIAYYEANRARYEREPERIRVGHILVTDARLADQLLAEVASPEADFAALAREHSVDEGTRARGGETDWFSRVGSPFSEKVTDAVWLSEVGQTKLVDDDEGFHIVRLLERRPAGAPPFADIRDEVRADFVRDEEIRRWDTWYTERRDRAQVSSADPVLAAAMVLGTDRAKARAELEAARARGGVDDPYLAYYIGRLHEDALTSAATRRAQIEGKDEPTSEELAEAERLLADEERHREAAVAAYLSFMGAGAGDEAFFQRLLNLDPENAEARAASAEMYRQAGNWIRAESEYRRAIEARPEFVPAHIGHGDVLMAMELYTRAAEAYRRALDLQPGSVSVALRLAGAYVRDGRLTEAEPVLQDVLAREANNPTALLLLGDVLLAQGDTAGAISRYDAAYRRGLTADALLKLAGAYLADGQLAEARRRFEDAIRVFPYRAEGYVGLGDVHAALGDNDRALSSYRQALARAVTVSAKESVARKIVPLDPGDIRTRYLLAGYLREQYKYDGAIVQYEAILELAPGTLDALVGLGDAYLAKVQHDRALEYYRQALDVAATPLQKLPIYTQMVRVEESRAGVGGELGPLGLEFLWQRAQAYAELFRFQEAVADLRRIEGADPTFRTEEVAALLERLTLTEPR